MTRSDVFMKILAEIVTEHKAEVKELLDTFQETMPGIDRLDRDLAPEEADQLFADLQKNKDNIRIWLLQGRNKFIAQAKKSRKSA